MKIGLHDSDNTSFPNYALMKISSYHKRVGDSVEWWNPLFSTDIVYSSKIFTFTPKDSYLPKDAILGGTGYDVKSQLPINIENQIPDYSIYPNIDYSVGFLTRGCPNKCKWCVVPDKEGDIKEYSDIEEIAIKRNVVLMDNNVLASEFGIRQLEKIGKMNIKIDFNQGLDARRIDRSVAKLLSKCKWLKPVRLACDTSSQKESIKMAVKIMREENVTPKAYFCYVLIKDIEDALDRVMFLKELGVDPFAQPYRDFENNIEPTKNQKKFARWVNHKAIFKTVKWKDYK